MKIVFRTNLDLHLNDKLGWPEVDSLHYSPRRGDCIVNTYEWKGGKHLMLEVDQVTLDTNHGSPYLSVELGMPFWMRSSIGGYTT